MAKWRAVQPLEAVLSHFEEAAAPQIEHNINVPITEIADIDCGVRESHQRVQEKGVGEKGAEKKAASQTVRTKDGVVQL